MYARRCDACPFVASRTIYVALDVRTLAFAPAAVCDRCAIDRARHPVAAGAIRKRGWASPLEAAP